MPRRALCACTKCAPWLGVPTAIWMSAVWTQWVRSGNAVTAQWGLLGRHEDAVRMQWGRIWSPPYTTIIRECNEGIKKKHWQISEFQFPKPYFSHFVRLNIAIKRIPHIFPWLCAWDVCHIIFCHLLHKHSGKTGILFSLLLCSLWWVQILFVCLYITPSHYHHCANLSEDIELIKCPSDIFCRVCEWD